MGAIEHTSLSYFTTCNNLVIHFNVISNRYNFSFPCFYGAVIRDQDN